MTQQTIDIPDLREDYGEPRIDTVGYLGKRMPRGPRGRPKSKNPKRPVSLRLDPDVLTHFRRSGRGWQSRVNAVLRKAAKLPAKKIGTSVSQAERSKANLFALAIRSAGRKRISKEVRRLFRMR